jgi:hypothetical protein
MASSRPPPTTSSSAIIVQKLADLFRTNGHRVLRGDSKVCFTSDSLTLLNNYFQSAKLDLTLPDINENPRRSSIPPLPQLPPVQHLRIDTKLRDNLVFLHDFLQKIQVVKVSFIVNVFHCLVFLFLFLVNSKFTNTSRKCSSLSISTCYLS